MELNLRDEPLSFQLLYTRLLAFVNTSIHNGELSERSLAKLMGVSQPHLHNVLKGARRLHAPLADALLARYRITPLDLLTSAELSSRAPAADLPPGAHIFPTASPAHTLPMPRKQPSSTSRSDRHEWEAS